MPHRPTDLERTQELFEFLQGEIPDGYRIKRQSVPKLTAEQAWTVVWYIQEQHWQAPDHIERCELCGDLYNSHSEGDLLDYGKGPYHFCDGCMNTSEYNRKSRRNPDKSLRPREDD